MIKGILILGSVLIFGTLSVVFLKYTAAKKTMTQSLAIIEKSEIVPEKKNQLIGCINQLDNEYFIIGSRSSNHVLVYYLTTMVSDGLTQDEYDRWINLFENREFIESRDIRKINKMIRTEEAG